jgi:methyl-accepting chemotaxis protein
MADTIKNQTKESLNNLSQVLENILDKNNFSTEKLTSLNEKLNSNADRINKIEEKLSNISQLNSDTLSNIVKIKEYLTANEDDKLDLGKIQKESIEKITDSIDQLQLTLTDLFTVYSDNIKKDNENTFKIIENIKNIKETQENQLNYNKDTLMLLEKITKQLQNVKTPKFKFYEHELRYAQKLLTDMAKAKNENIKKD